MICTEKKIRKNIKNELNMIKDIDTLTKIENFIKESKPINLNTYINIHFDKYHKEIRKELEHQVRETWLEINNQFEPSCSYIDHFCELYVQGYSLDIWIAENGCLFSSYEMANIIFKLWTKEIVFQ